MNVLRCRIGWFAGRAPLAEALLAGMLLSSGLGCGGSGKDAAAPRPRPLHLTFVSSAETNGGTALHVLVRKTTKTDYPRQDYDDVAKTLLLESDPNTLDWLVVTPASTREVVVARPTDAQVGVYFLFSAPGARWRHLVDDESIERVEFEVGRDEIKELPMPALARTSGREGSGKGR